MAGLKVNSADAWIALLGTLFGGVGLKAVESWMNRNKEKDDYDARQRKELRDDLAQTREELHRAEEALDKIRYKHYSLIDDFITVRAELIDALRTLRATGATVEEPVLQTLEEILKDANIDDKE